MSVTIEDLTILDEALMYSGTFSSTSFRKFLFPGAFLGTLPFPITTVLSVGEIPEELGKEAEGMESDKAIEGTGG